LVAAFGVLLALPTLWQGSVRFLPSMFHPISLGLDLKGGAQLLLSVDTDAMMKERANGLYESVRGAMLNREKGIIRFQDLRSNSGLISLSVRDAGDVSKAKGRIKSAVSDAEVSSSGNTITVGYSEQEKERMMSGALSRSIEIIRRRIDEFGTKEPSIQSQGGKYILVQLPGVDNPEHIKELIGQTAKMTFHLVNENITDEQIASGRPPIGTEFLPMADGMGVVPVYSRVELSGESLTDSQASFDQNNMPVVTQEFDSAGARRFAKLTTDHVNERFAIVLDGKVLSAPTIREPIIGGRGQISGSFTTRTAQNLAVMLRSGALPAPLSVIEERTVGAGLGGDTISSGKVACVWGFALIILFMFLVYGKFGLIADGVLIVNLLMIIGISALFGATLTLPGIAGIVLTLGMAVDANILPFERMRDEIKIGSSPLRAVDMGFSKAFKAVLDGNLTTLICALVLFQFGAGPIRGFAVTLSIGIVTTLFTCIPLAHLIIDIYMNGKNKKIGFVKEVK
ncbi:MAG: protein translocase subunit SecD, partial [Rickettsiales bacterium]|nr:protein translocase subunit SecD [Rickettsiales bacterium]